MTTPARSLVLASSFVLAACAVGPDFHAPAAPDTPTYTREALPSATASAPGTGGAPQTFASADHAPRAWWTQFGSPALDALVDEALRASPTLESARAKLVEARENYNAQAGATLFPSIDAKLSGTRQKIDLAAFGITQVPNPGPFTLYDASVSISYVFDIFGANRRALEATLAQVNYQEYELQAAQLSVAGNVVAAALRRASLRSQIDTTQQLIDAQTRQLAIIEARLAAGGVARLDVHSQRTLLAQTRATLPPLTTQLAQTDHQLAILLGAPPSSDAYVQARDALTLDALHLPDTVALTLPATLARERPDIRASEALLHQASANIGVATANLFPQISLSASVGSERTRVADVIGGLNIWNVGLGLTQPIFHGGELRAKRRASQAAYDAAFADYRQTVLLALQQVADTLHALQDDALELQARDTAAREAQASADIARARYAAGGVSEFDLVDAQRQALQTALDRTRAQTTRLADTAALYQSLGGAALPGDAAP
ncbi:efflux transporter outer membrane subunit [Paraburkholderia tropica]|uniref:NodT family efflux transporter outer membrane factor (OMF) lipoprotein n=1 Tax=Paraburkholderia tropica TaxID=92647 RepID=A0ABX5MUY9_9BURK|nr:efflux transporter outer membrane subunit [Paraburkholderia tropica]MDE1139143.1 efflux transporter outer membrane subunit [Paraburkholderia tropica]PXX19588.1 NodT family efflux transporter outer membrane factor (OMF) lipoprotein [Paraburkholderia tropica]PZW88529.1 NodT family efflux transporter outer membrane factor (OMF) lipoprotein [Paraburkholderia tropica]